MRGAAITKSQARSPARQALADAIARHREVEVELAQKKTARARTSAQVSEAELKVQDKRRLLDEAREAHVDKLEAAHDAGHNVATAPALGVREARDVLHQAEDDLDTLRTLLERMDARLAGPAQPVEAAPIEDERAAQYVMTPHGLQPRYSDRRPPMTSRIYSSEPEPFDWLAATQRQVAKAAEAVAREHCDAILVAAVERARSAIAEAQAAGAAVAVLAHRGIIGEHHADLLKRMPRGIVVPTVKAWHDSVRAFRCDAEGIADPASIGQPLPAMVGRLAAWNDAMAALQHDADAELPA